MSPSNQHEEIAFVLKQYGAEVYFIENFGRVKRINSNKGILALKEISPNKGMEFFRHLQFLYQKGFNRIVPVFPTLDGRYAVLTGNKLYYVMPWLPNEERGDYKERYKQLFRELARLHHLSSQEVNVKLEDRKEHYEATKEEWEKELEFLEGFIDYCEQKTYMSPFELLYCLYYREIRQTLNFSKAKLEEWFNTTKEKEKARVVIIHGKLSHEHFLYDDRGYGYFVNFEDAHLASPIHDLLPFLSKWLSGYPKRCDECVQWFTIYSRHFGFQAEEMQLFLSYLAYPGELIRIVKEYYQQQYETSEQKAAQRLQRQYWQMKNTEYIVMRIDELERQKNTGKGVQST